MKYYDSLVVGKLAPDSENMILSNFMLGSYTGQWNQRKVTNLMMKDD